MNIPLWKPGENNLFDPAVKQQFLQNKLLQAQDEGKRIENQLFAPKTMAEIASKSMYAQSQPAMTYAKLLENQALMSGLPEEQLRQIQQGAIQSLNFLPRSGVNSVSPYSLSNQSPIGNNSNVFNQLKNMYGERGAQQIINNLQSPEDLQNFGISPEDTGPGSVQTGGNDRPILAAPTSQAKVLAELRQPGSRGGTNPASAAETEKKIATAFGEKQAQKEAEAMYDYKKEAQAGLSAARDMEKEIKNFDYWYGKTNQLQKGPVGGRLPAVTGAAQETDRAQKRLGIAVVALGKFGQLSKSEGEWAQTLDVGREMSQEARQDVLKAAPLFSERLKNKVPFINVITSKNPDIQQSEVEALWSSYMDQFPVFDPQTRQTYPENLDKWTDFTSPDAVYEARTNGKYVSPDAITDESNAIEGAPESPKYSQEDLEFTARKHKKTVAEIKRMLEAQ